LSARGSNRKRSTYKTAAQKEIGWRGAQNKQIKNN